MRAALGWAGRNGTWVVIAGVVLGFALPPLSAAARPWLVASIFVFTFGALLKFDPAAFRHDVAHGRRNAAIVVWATLGVPLLVGSAIRLVHPEPGLAQGLLFWALVPSSGACVAFAVLLGLRVPLALLATVVATAASPFAMPWLASALGGVELRVEPGALCLKLLAIVGGAWLVAWLVKRRAGGFVRSNPDAMTGIAVVALFVAGLGSMRGMLQRFLAEPVRTLEVLVLAYAVFAAVHLLSTLLFRRSGMSAALTAGLVSATRTVTLAWVVLGDQVLPMADVFFGCAMVAKYTMPGLVRPLFSRLLADERIDATAAAAGAGGSTAPGIATRT